MAGILAAIIALPLLWLLGGTLEPTPRGVWWIAVWLTVSSVLLLFAIAPFFLWLDGRKTATALSKSTEAATKLARLLTMSDKLCARRIKSDAEYGQFRQELVAFINSIPGDISGAITAPEMAVLLSRPPTDVIGRGDGFNESHNANLHALETISRRLTALIHKYSA